MQLLLSAAHGMQLGNPDVEMENAVQMQNRVLAEEARAALEYQRRDILNKKLEHHLMKNAPIPRFEMWWDRAVQCLGGVQIHVIDRIT